MGSFINQCFATRQAINERERCRVIPLVQSRTYRTATCTRASWPEGPVQEAYGAGWSAGISSKWRPMGGFLEVTAGDRADTTLIHSDSTKVLLEQLFKDMFKLTAQSVLEDQDDNFDFMALCEQHAPQFWTDVQKNDQGRDTPLLSADEADAVWTHLGEPFMRMQVFMADHGHVFRSMSLGIIREDAYQWLLKEGQKSDRYGGYDRIKYIDKVAQAALKRVQDAVPRDSSPDELELSKAFFIASDLREDLRFISGGIYGNMIAWSTQLHELVLTHLRTGAPLADLIREELKGYLDDSYVMRGLDLCGVPFAPMFSIGQEYDNSTGKRFARLVSAVSRTVTAELKRDSTA